MFPEILYEDNHLFIVNKPAGLLTQADSSGAPSLLDSLKSYIKKRDKKTGNVFLGMVQRLDRPVSGVIVFAKTSKSASRLSRQIRDRTISKIYIGITGLSENREVLYGDWQKVCHQLVRVRDKTIIAECSESRSKRGVLVIKTIFTGRKAQLHMIRLITGRKHQIRAQLAHMGKPLLGDRKYGSAIGYPVDGGIGLHAYFCRLKHPVKPVEIEVLSDVPHTMLQSFSQKERAFISAALAQEIARI